MVNENIRMAVKKADVVLVNNEVFSPDLNRRLVHFFLDLKEGCRVVSLKSLVPHGHQITDRNHGDPANILDVKEEHLTKGDVSWTDQGNSYFIAAVDRERLKPFKDSFH